MGIRDLPAGGFLRALALQEKESYKWWVLVTVSLGALGVSLDSSIIIVCLPTLAKVFHTDSSVIGWVNIAYLMMSQSMGPILARVGDGKGRKMVYMTGLAFYTLGLFACSVAQGPLQLILSRAVQGVGAATGWSLSMALVVAVFPGAERGRALGTLAGAYSVGLVLGPILGGLILDMLGWRAVFWVRMPIALAALLMTWIIIKEQKGEDTVFHLDLRGALSLFGCLSALMLAFNFAGKKGFGNPLPLSLGAAVIVLFGLFLFVEKRAVQPIIGLSLFKNRLFSASIFCGGLQAASAMVAIFLIPFYLASVLGYSGAKVGLTMSVLAAPVLIFSPITGRLSDKIGSQFLSALGMAVLFGALFSLSHLGIEPGRFHLLVSIALIGLSMAIFQSPNNSSAMGAVPKDMLGTASAILSTVRNIGSSSAIAVSSALFSSYQIYHFAQISAGSSDLFIAHRIASAASFHDSLVIGMIICAAGFLATLVRR